MNTTINGVGVDTVVGTVLTFTLDETLDTGTVVVPFITSPDQYKRWDLLTLTRDGIIKDFLISAVIPVVISKKPLIYEVSLQLIEYTKKLERYTISTSVTTQPGGVYKGEFANLSAITTLYPNGIGDAFVRANWYARSIAIDENYHWNTLTNSWATDENRTQRVPWTIKEVIELLIKKVSFQRSSLFAIPFVLDAATASALDEFIAPELQYNGKTLREAIDDVLKNVGAISYLKKIGGVDTIFITKYNKLKTELTNIQKIGQEISSNINDYATDAIVNVSNGITKSGNVWYPDKNIFGVSRDTNENGLLETGDLIFNVSQNIYKANSFRLYFEITYVLSGGGGVDVWIEMEAIDYLYEETKWKDLPPAGEGFTDEQVTGEATKTNTVYYTSGSSSIKGLSDEITYGLPFYTGTRLGRLAETLARQWVIENTPGGTIFNTIKTEEKDIMFKINYDSLLNANNIKLGRADISEVNKRTAMYVNQMDRLIDLTDLGRNIQGKIDRMGLEQTSFNVLHATFDEVYNLGDFTTEGIISEISLVFEEDMVRATYTATKNFNRISEFIGVDRAYRAYDILQADASRIRTVTYKDYVQITTDLETASNTSIMTANGILQVSNKLKGLASDTVSGIIFTRFIEGVSQPPITIGTSDTPFGHSLVISWAFEHPLYAGFKRITEGNTIVTEPVSYVQAEGELDSFWIQGYSSLIDYSGDPATSKFVADSLPEYLPTIPTDKLLFKNIPTDLFQVFKDPSEILAMNYMLEFYGDKPIGVSKNKIIIGNALTENCGLISGDITDMILYRSTEYYDASDVNAVKGTSTADVIVVAAETYGFTISSAISLSGYESWAIGDADGNLYFAVNRNPLQIPSLSLSSTVAFKFSNSKEGMQLL